MLQKIKRTLTISFSSFNVISDETFSSCDPFKFRLVLDGLVFSIFGFFATTCNQKIYLNIMKSCVSVSNVFLELVTTGLLFQRSRNREKKQHEGEETEQLACSKIVET